MTTTSPKLDFASQEIQDVTVVAACGPPGGGRNAVSPRLLKNFWLVNQLIFLSLQFVYVFP